MATNGLGTRRTLSRPRKRLTCTQPKQPQPPLHLVAVLHGEDLRFREVEEAVEGKEVPASKAFKKKLSSCQVSKWPYPVQTILLCGIKWANNFNELFGLDFFYVRETWNISS